MDKFKEILAVVGKHHFWFLSGIVALAVLISWYSTTGTLATETKGNMSKIDRQFNDMAGITRDTEHPTDAYQVAVKDREDQLRTITLEAWKTLYDAQQPVFQWPDIPDFRGRKEPFPITLQMRTDYKNYVRDQFPVLFKLVQVREEVLLDGQVGTAGDYISRSVGQNHMAQYVGVVDWYPAQRELLQVPYTLQKTPSERQVRLAHEDITVYRALLMIIRATNDFFDATDNRNAAVKRINYLAIGQAFWIQQTADRAQVMILPPHGAVAANGSSDPSGSQAADPYDSYDNPTSSREVTLGGTAAGSLDEMLMANRYLDEQWNPVTGKAAIENPPFAEFKQMPVRMGLTVDQRRIPVLLASCANSPLTVEVRQVRYNPGTPEAAEIVQQTMQIAYSSGAAATSGILSGGHGYNRRPPRRRSINPYGQQNRRRGGLLGNEVGPNDMDIEIRGIVYIYNRPDEAKLGTGTATDASQRAALGFPQLKSSGGGFSRGYRGGGGGGDTDS